MTGKETETRKKRTLRKIVEKNDATKKAFNEKTKDTGDNKITIYKKRKGSNKKITIGNKKMNKDQQLVKVVQNKTDNSKISKNNVSECKKMICFLTIFCCQYES